jgi:hypothetical protein
MMLVVHVFARMNTAYGINRNHIRDSSPAKQEAYYCTELWSQSSGDRPASGGPSYKLREAGGGGGR